jgi:hypothetical protein
MGRFMNFFLSLPAMCERLTFNELLLAGASLTLVATVVLVISGRRIF